MDLFSTDLGKSKLPFFNSSDDQDAFKGEIDSILTKDEESRR